MRSERMCGSCLQRHSHVSPSDAVQGPEIREIRKGRWIRIQHIRPKTWRLHVAQDNEGAVYMVNPAKSSSGQNSNRNSSTTTHSSCMHDTQSSSLTSMNTTVSKTSTVRSRVSSTHKSRTSLHSAFDDGNVLMFFIHGVGGSSDVWRNQMDYFVQEGFEVIAPDLLGHGFSRAPRQTSAYAFAELAEDMLAVFDSYSKRRNILVGHSYGSSFCTKIARERSRKVTKMILLNGGGPIALEPQPCQVFGLPACMLCCMKPFIADMFKRRAFHTKEAKNPANKQRAFDVPSYVLQGMMKGQQWMEGDEDYHLEIAVAVLLIYGMQDKFVSLEEEEWMQETIYACELTTIESAGHMIMIECPDKVNKIIHEFIQKDMMISKSYKPTAVTRQKHAQVTLEDL